MGVRGEMLKFKSAHSVISDAANTYEHSPTKSFEAKCLQGEGGQAIYEANFAKSAFEVYPRVKFSFVLMRFSLPPRRYTYANKRSSRAIFFLRKPKFMELVYDSHSYSLHPACPSSPLIALTFTYLAFFPRICTYKCVTPSRLNSLQMGRLRRNVFSFLSCILGIGE